MPQVVDCGALALHLTLALCEKTGQFASDIPGDIRTIVFGHPRSYAHVPRLARMLRAGDYDAVFSMTAMNLAVYLFLGEIFIFVYAAAVGSLSIRMLVAMLELDAHPDAFERMLGRCSPDFFLEARLRSMLRQQLICQEAERYSLTEKGRRWARAARALKAFLAVGRGG